MSSSLLSLLRLKESSMSIMNRVNIIFPYIAHFNEKKNV